MPLCRRRAARCAVIVGLAVLAWGCASRGGSAPAASPPAVDPPAPVLPQDGPDLSVRGGQAGFTPEAAAAPCALVSEPGEPIATVGLADRVDPANAPHGVNQSERLLFRQLYETLVRVDCEGRAQPGLAASWQPDSTSPRTWIVTLRAGARFADGTPVTPGDVISSWIAGGALRPGPGRIVESAAPIDDRALAITLHAARAGVPLALADTRLAVAKRATGSPWPMGTRDVQAATEPLPDSAGRLVIALAGSARSGPIGGAGGAPFARFVVAEGRDRRDFLDERVDLLLTDDPVALDYAATLPQFQSIPLAWHRTHVFVSRWRGRSLPMPSLEAVQALARDAVRGEARGAEGPFWWQAPPGCDVTRPGPRDPPAASSARIVYEQGDEPSRDLAERVMGLARTPSAGPPSILDTLLPGPLDRTLQRAIGLGRDDLTAAVGRGVEAGYLLSFDRAPLDACLTMRETLERIPWLDPDTIVPLVDTRIRAIVRRGRAGATVEGDAVVLLR